jgi:hypothetical protein
VRRSRGNLRSEPNHLGVRPRAVLTRT